MKYFLRLFLLLDLGITASTVCAQISVYDVSPRLNTTLGNITTYGYADRTNSLTPNELRINSYFFGDYGDPYYDQDPGFRALPAQSGKIPSGLPDGSWLSFDVMSDLQYWNGTGTVTFGNVPAGETIQMYVPPSPTYPFVTTVGAGGGPYPRSGFPIAEVVDGTTGSPNGGSNPGYFHQHLWSELQAPNGATPADGVYLYELRVKLLESDQQTPYPGVAPSLPFFVMFDNNESLATYQAAQSWVQANLVPFGDFNRDGVTTAADVSAMLAALSDLNTYKANHQLTDFDLMAFGDVNQDGVIDNRDVQALITYLANGGTGDTGLGSGSLAVVPEPATSALFALGGCFVIGITRRSRCSQFCFVRTG